MPIPTDRLSRILASFAAQPEALSRLERLVHVVAHLLHADGAVVVMVQYGAVGTVLAEAGDGGRSLLERQVEVGVGPSLEAHLADGPVIAADLFDGSETRWPPLLAALDVDGVRAVLAVPIRVGAVRLGSLGVHRNRPGTWTLDEELDAVAVADLVASAVLDQLGGVAGDELTMPPHQAVIHQATGMLAVELEVDLLGALARLRGEAFATGRPLYDVAVDVVAGSLKLEP